MINAIKRALKGEEKLWKVFWLWGVLLYVSSIVVGFLTVFSPLNHTPIGFFVGLLGLALIFIYPFLFCISIWKCSKNTKQQFFKYFARIFIFIFFPFHAWFSGAIALGTMVLLSIK